jgi:diadenosine tetraphosphate (Ap4A) HIT family hydrolase
MASEAAVINPTIEKFGYPGSLLREYEHWLVLLRPAQVTAGSLVLAAKGEATAYGELSREAFAEQAAVIAEIEAALSRAVHYDRINYLMLMMVDPHVHFHVIPRYAGSRSIAGIEIADAGWPGPPELKSAISLESEAMAAIRSEIRSNWQVTKPKAG